MTVYTSPRFEVEKNGFKFNNTFDNTMLANDIAQTLNLPFPIPDLFFGNPIRTSGRCGGMTYAALDYFLSDNYEIPSIKSLPPDGDVVADYIQKRQFDSFFHIGDEYILNAIVPNMGTDFYKRSLPPTGHSFSFYKEQIDKNNCRPLALLPLGDGNLIGHQVLGIGYTDNPNPEKALIHIYDPNCYKNERVLKLNKSKEAWDVYNYIDGEVADRVARYKAWIAADGYSPVIPNITDNYNGTRNYSGRDLRKWKTPEKEDLTRYKFDSANFTGNKDLKSCDFRQVSARRTIFSNTDASSSNFTKSDLTHSQFKGANLRNSTFNEAKLHGANFANTELSDASFQDIEANEFYTFFNNSKFNETIFNGAKVRGFFNEVAITISQFKEVNLQYSHFIGSSVNRTSFLKAILCDTIWFNAALNNCNFNYSELERINFNNAAIKNSSFVSANCYKGNFFGAAFKDVNFKNADLRYAKLDGTAFHDVDFTGVDYTGSSWIGASIRRPWRMTPTMFSWLVARGVRFL